MKITANHPGGNIVVINQNDNLAVLKVDIRDTTERWFYWNFAVSGANGKSITFQFAEDELIGRFGPAKSIDMINWAFLKDECDFSSASFTYNFKQNEDKVYFAFSLPYQYSHFESFYKKAGHNNAVRLTSLTKTIKGDRDVPLLVIGDDASKGDIVFSCRNHCCESVASYVLEGIMEYIIDNYSSFKGYRFHIVPFVDLDGVENGDQGKSRFPHDHNRDYTDKPIYETVKAWMGYVAKLNLVMGIDFHCPWKWGGGNDYMAFVKPLIELSDNIEEFSSVLKQQAEQDTFENKIIYEGDFDLMPGQSWLPVIPNSTAASFYGRSGARVAFTLEVPYFGLDCEHTQENTVHFGKVFAKSLELYLK